MKDNNKISYSIIIPHKNTPELLHRCLKSIPLRDDVQVIIIDDNSDPNKVVFSAFPGLNRPYTEVYFLKEQKGAGYARNMGLSKVRGNWIVFADADDFLMIVLVKFLINIKELKLTLFYFRQTQSIMIH